jgi:nucleoid-associated protein YgaU
MSDKAGRVFAGLCVLSLVWIGVYWWVPRAPGIRFATTTPGEFPVEPLPLAAMRTDSQPRPERKPEIRAAEPSLRSPPTPPTPAPLSLSHTPTSAAPTAPGTGTAGKAKPENKTYKVVAGDTFRTISERFYGTSKHAVAIAKANPFLDPARLSPGKVVIIPPDPDHPQAVPASAGLPPAPASTTAPGQAASSPKVATPAAAADEYVVEAGDTLSGIAGKLLGDQGKAKAIFELNRDRLKSENALKIGQKLRIPAKDKA